MRWLLATGYTNLWIRIHRAEEALLEIAPEEVLIREALFDDLRLQGSTIPNASELLRRIRLAAEDLGPDAARYIGRQQAGSGREKAASDNDSTARAVLREVRRSVNDFRDDCREGIVRGRNRLYATVLFTGLATYGLLGLAVASDAGKSEVIAGTAFYLVGGIVGLFKQLHSAAAADTITEEDYGLSLARLLQTPLFSGLAAVGGVVVTALAVAVIPSGGTDASDPAPLAHRDLQPLLEPGRPRHRRRLRAGALAADLAPARSGRAVQDRSQVVGGGAALEVRRLS